MNLTTATYRILYNNRNITTDVSDHLLSLTYTDKVAGEADEIELRLEDADNLWQNDWFPEKGATITAEISSGDSKLECGSFYLDEIELSSDASGDVVSLRGIAAYFSKAMRTKRHKAHENKSLGEIARTVAGKHGLSIVGSIPDITIGRVTQSGKGDLSFLQGLANEYGYVFSVRAGKMTWTDVTALEKAGSVLSIDKADVASLSVRDKTGETYKRANVSFHNPANKELVDYTSDADSNTSEDTLAIRSKAENKQQAERKAKAALHNANSYTIEGNAEIQGNSLLVSGVNFELTGCGRLSGLYHITQSTHAISRDSSYVTSIEIKKVGAVPASKFISKAKKATPQ
jgi:phage protein D